MFNIAEYLQKYANLEGDSAFQKEVIRKALKEVCGLEGVDFELKKGTLYLKAGPMEKSLVFMKKDALVEYLRKNFPKGRVGDVR